MQVQTNSTQNVTEITGLGASGPFPGLEDKLSLFGQFVGDWDILEDWNIQDDGSKTVLDGNFTGDGF